MTGIYYYGVHENVNQGETQLTIKNDCSIIAVQCNLVVVPFASLLYIPLFRTNEFSSICISCLHFP